MLFATLKENYIEAIFTFCFIPRFDSYIYDDDGESYPDSTI